MSNLPPIDDSEFIAKQQAKTAADLAAEAQRQAEYHAAHPLDRSEAGMRSRGVVPATDLTSPGGPWHGLPEDAQRPGDRFAENQRWAIVENPSWYVVTKDGTENVGDNADNILGYIEPGESGAVNLRRNSSLAKRIEMGNAIAHRGDSNA